MGRRNKSRGRRLPTKGEGCKTGLGRCMGIDEEEGSVRRRCMREEVKSKEVSGGDIGGNRRTGRR